MYSAYLHEPADEATDQALERKDASSSSITAARSQHLTSNEISFQNGILHQTPVQL
ncbi:uncharacterized protein PHALS_06834 [Plasmopara halstedii]|uniref:Uncharacterized protein n=1 Tax=Plasmopara halstedii TaxID=4781 RepID=A0A0P1B2Q3_PLAHL|nr:uncharacterized protein PHALS_06834 [Plasmopara halstedii]CEG49044.1 hypothetical protein PHALS_06834 [Plasmopara halstedii]|eukprot:XP_024585413.1 hypothetical protein PHALS_06834 [Plasmopara halstedii]